MTTEDVSTGPLASEVVPLTMGKDAIGGLYDEDAAAEVKFAGAGGAAVANGSAGNDPVGTIAASVEEATPAEDWTPDTEDGANMAEAMELAAVPTASTTAVTGARTSVALGKHLFPAAK